MPFVRAVQNTKTNEMKKQINKKRERISSQAKAVRGLWGQLGARVLPAWGGPGRGVQPTAASTAPRKGVLKPSASFKSLK